MFYFMPAARFVGIESGEIVNFLGRREPAFETSQNPHPWRCRECAAAGGDDNREKVASLLNLTDGMMGEALGLHVVCTLNCDLSDLDPALLRPGRLIGQREMGPLAVDEARRLAAHPGRPLPTGPATIAEILHGKHDPAMHASKPRRSLGFHAVSQA